MAEPSADQKRQLAKMGLAMPDGSYYIREGAVGVGDLQNAILAVGRGEPQSSHDAIRRHIIKRAADLKRTDMIPDNWAPDGSLKHFDSDLRDILEFDDALEFEDFLAHHGIKGMHWGHHKSRSAEDLNSKAAEHEQISVARAHQAMALRKDHEDLLQNGVKSAPFRRLYGEHAHQQTDAEFFRNNRETKAQALQRTDNDLRLLSNHYTRSANSHAKKASKLREKAKSAGGVQHADGSPESSTLPAKSAGPVLLHHGVKGMHWGVRRASNPGVHRVSVPRGSSEDHQQVAVIKDKIKVNKGVHSLSNAELKTVTERLNLEQQYSRLAAEPGKIDKGRKFVKTIVGDAKTVVDAVDTGKRAYGITQDVKKVRTTK